MLINQEKVQLPIQHAELFQQMPAPDQVAQGENYDFSQTLGEGVETGDNNIDGFTYRVDVKQFPDDVAAISKALNNVSGPTVKGTLTPAETATLAIGLWYLIITSVDLDEEIQTTRRIQVVKTWV